jgi:glycosyltransferase involved in cell wall biosynthesis
MRVAVVTPYYKESLDVLIRCRDSVKNQTYKDTTHIMIADGYPKAICKGWDVEHFELPYSHNDAGATPRALAAISAFSRGYDAVAFLDADNWYEPDHVECMVNTVISNNVPIAIATRRIHALDGKGLYVDNVESNGENMVDTNSMFLTAAALHLLTYWVVDPSQRLWSDRYFWEAVKQSKLPIKRCLTPTVAYVTKWAWHYDYAGVEPPPDSVWIDKDAAGNLIHTKHKDRKGVK